MTSKLGYCLLVAERLPEFDYDCRSAIRFNASHALGTRQGTAAEAHTGVGCLRILLPQEQTNGHK
jgi:hypothetical protein